MLNKIQMKKIWKSEKHECMYAWDYAMIQKIPDLKAIVIMNLFFHLAQKDERIALNLSLLRIY